MRRGNARATWGLTTGLVLLLSGCGGGGGGTASGSHPIAPPPTAADIPTATTVAAAEPTDTPLPAAGPTATPLPPGPSRNEHTTTSAAGSITLRLQSISILVGQTTFFSVFLFDDHGHPVANQPISLTSDPGGGINGGFFDDGNTRADGTANGFLTGADPGGFVLTASAGEGAPFNGLSTSLTVIVSGVPSFPTPTEGVSPTPTAIVPAGLPASITLDADPTQIQVFGTGGTELSTIVGRVRGNDGRPLSGVSVHYHVVTDESAAGAVILPLTTPEADTSPTPGASQATSLCEASDPVAISDGSGAAVIQLRSGTQAGPVTVQACADSKDTHGKPIALEAQRALVTVTSGPVRHIGLSIASSSTDNHDGTLESVVSAILTDAQGNVVQDGTPVYFEILPPQICSGGSNDGLPCFSNVGCPGGTCVDDTSNPEFDVAISSNSTTNAAPPCNVAGVLPQPGDAVTCIKFPERLQGTEVRVRASSAGVTNNPAGQRLMLPGQITGGDLQVTVSPPRVEVSDTEDGLATVRAVVSDSTLEGIPNVRVRFTTTLGSIDRSALTDENGEATATLVIPHGTAPGTATVHVSAPGLTAQDVDVPVVAKAGGNTPTPGGNGPAAIQFEGAVPASIGVRGSGLPEQSTLTFKVTDAFAKPLAGVTVDFSIAQVADESLAPHQAVTDSNGTVQVVLTSGTRAISVQVTARVNSVSPPLVTRSTAVSILGGPPSQPNFSLARQFANVSGGVFFGTTDEITAFVADRFGNPVPPGTAVNFTTTGGAIGNATATSALGQAVATLVTQEPVPSNGIVNVLATTVGERPFSDTNGNGVCDAQDQLMPISEPFYDTNCNGVHDPGENFIDLNGNGCFDSDQGSNSPDCKTPGTQVPTCADQVVVFDSICVTFSGPTQVLVASSSSGAIPAGGQRDFTLVISDNPDPIGNPGVGNPIVGGSKYTLTITGGSRGTIVGATDFTIDDAITYDHIVDGVNRFHFSVKDSAPTSTTSDSELLTVSVTSGVNSLPAGGNGNVLVQVPIVFQAAATPTPLPPTPTPPFTPTFTPPPTPTVTPTPTPPAAFIRLDLVDNQASANGDGSFSTVIDALVTTATGAVVGDGVVVDFSLVSPVAGISVTSPGLTHQSAPCTLGFTVVAQPGDALSCIKYVQSLAGTTIVVHARVRKPDGTFLEQNSNPIVLPDLRPPVTATATPTPLPPANIQLALFVSQASNNGDGTLTSVIGALVTDQNGATVSDGVAVNFSVVPPTSGASVTSPGFTGQAAPCSLGFTVVPQPGDALSCIKYDIALQGTSITIQAQVAGVAAKQQTIVLPDLRTIAPTRTATNTPLPTLVPSSTPTSTFTATQTPPTATPTVTPTGTPTPLLPDLNPHQSMLFAGPNCHGTSQSFVVTGGAPPFAISSAGQGCLSTTSVSVSGGTVTFTATSSAPSLPVTITAQDTRGEIATAAVSVQAPAALIKADLLANVRSDNGDATFSSVISALVTDKNGVTVPDGLPVEFSLVPPIPAGVSVTSPGFTHSGPPCTVSFQVVPQPGDALSCIKYTNSLQGTTVTIRAAVACDPSDPTIDCPPEGVIFDTRTISLPDTRPTPSPTLTWTFTPTSTLTPTLTPSLTPTVSPTATFAAGVTPPPSFTPTPTLTPLPTLTATPTVPVGSLKFISAVPSTIGVRASGLPEQSVLTFQAEDTLAQPIAGATVHFVLTGSGSELLNPAVATTDAAGFVSTTVTSGTRATTIRVTAQADSNGDGVPDIFVQSQVVSILGAPPAFNHFSVGPLKHNIAGRVTLGLQDPVSAFVNDRFGNAVPPGTSVSFITNAASIVTPTVTDSSGRATATLLSEGIVPPTGIVTVLAFTRGEESFLDNNGNGEFDCLGSTTPPCQGRPGGDTVLTDNTPEPFIDFRPLPANLEPDSTKNDTTCTVGAPSSLCNHMFDINKPFELFVDSNSNGIFDIVAEPPLHAGNGNGVGQGTAGVWDNNIFVWSSTTVTFSGPLAPPQAFTLDGTLCQSGFGASNCYTFPLGGQEILTVTVHDDLFNPLVGGSTIAFSGSNGLGVTPDAITVPDSESFNQLVEGYTTFTIALTDARIGTPSDVARDTALTVTITSDNGGGTFLIAKGHIGP